LKEGTREEKKTSTHKTKKGMLGEGKKCARGKDYGDEGKKCQKKVFQRRGGAGKGRLGPAWVITGRKKIEKVASTRGGKMKKNRGVYGTVGVAKAGRGKEDKRVGETVACKE